MDELVKKTGDIKKLMIVCKDNAYGHGLGQIAPLLASCGVRHVALKDLEEAKKVRSTFDTILILPHTKSYDKDFSYAIHSLEVLKDVPSGVKIHIKIDTGMHRNGIFYHELEEAFGVCVKNNLILEGIFTHFYSADVLSGDYFVQMQKFKSVKKLSRELCVRFGLEVPKFHSCNSAGLLRHQGDFEDDFARVGIATYGYSDLPKCFGEFDLRPVLSLWADKISSRDIQKGDRVGYCGAYEAQEKLKISSYDIGYGDGLFRLFGEQRGFVANGKEFLGRISMDSFMIEGNESRVCLFSDARALANVANTIVYEILTSLKSEIKRKVIL